MIPWKGLFVFLVREETRANHCQSSLFFIRISGRNCENGQSLGGKSLLLAYSYWRGQTSPKLFKLFKLSEHCSLEFISRSQFSFFSLDSHVVLSGGLSLVLFFGSSEHSSVVGGKRIYSNLI